VVNQKPMETKSKNINQERIIKGASNLSKSAKKDQEK